MISEAQLHYFHKDGEITKPNEYGMTRVRELFGAYCPIFYDISNKLGYCIGATVKVRGRIDRIRAQSKIIFVILRGNGETLQCVHKKLDPSSDPLYNLLSRLTKESIIDIIGCVKNAA